MRNLPEKKLGGLRPDGGPGPDGAVAARPDGPGRDFRDGDAGGRGVLFPQQVLTVDSGETKADELVVLGGGEGRAERAAELYHQGAARGVLVTGYGDCASNVEVLKRAGVPASAITTEPTALSTFENATRSVPLLRQMGARRVIVVTSWFHSRRALACFEHVAPDIQFFSRPSYYHFEPATQRRTGFIPQVNMEYMKLLFYWGRYGICPL
ncbi:MAG: YdcF family protein [Verrucomicrobiota bacterium]